MSKQRKKELVSTILYNTAGLNPVEDNSDMYFEAHFITDKSNVVDGE